jgi:broad specificity phosphatase PhoE
MLLFFIRHGRQQILNHNYYESHLTEEGIRQTRLLALSNELPTPDLIFRLLITEPSKQQKYFAKYLR